MTEENKTHLIICPVSVEYKLILEPQQTFKSDGAVNPGKKVYFRGGRALVDDETFAILQTLPEWGIEFMEAKESDVLPEPVAPTVKRMGGEIDREEAKGQMELMQKQINMLTEVIGQFVSAGEQKKSSK